MSAVTNLPASVSARLLHRSRQTGDDCHGILTSYFLERFLNRIGASPPSLLAALRTICAANVPPDAVVFDGADIELTEIRAEDEYAGTRATLPARLGTAGLRSHPRDARLPSGDGGLANSVTLRFEPDKEADGRGIAEIEAGRSMMSVGWRQRCTDGLPYL